MEKQSFPFAFHNIEFWTLPSPMLVNNEDIEIFPFSPSTLYIVLDNR